MNLISSGGVYSSVKSVSDEVDGIDERVTTLESRKFYIPDYSQRTIVAQGASINGSYTVQQDGFIVPNLVAKNGIARLIINNITVNQIDYDGATTGSYATITGVYPVKQGDIIKYESKGGISYNYLLFYPPIS